MDDKNSVRFDKEVDIQKQKVACAVLDYLKKNSFYVSRKMETLKTFRWDIVISKT